MKGVFIILVLFYHNFVFSQNDPINDLISNVKIQAVKIDSLEKVIKAENDAHHSLKNQFDIYQDSVLKLNNKLSNLEKEIKRISSLDSILNLKNDSIYKLNKSLSEFVFHINKQNKINEQKIKDEYEKGKKEIFSQIINSYYYKSFDELLKTSTIQTVDQDLYLSQLFSHNDIILSDLKKYFNAHQLLYVKFDSLQVNKNLYYLDQIKRESSILVRLKQNLINYKKANEVLKEIIIRLQDYDKEYSVSGMSESIKIKKLIDILPKISLYIFSFDISFSDYPYLSEIVFELIKRKQGNPDADISDLLKKL